MRPSSMTTTLPTWPQTSMYLASSACSLVPPHLDGCDAARREEVEEASRGWVLKERHEGTVPKLDPLFEGEGLGDMRDDHDATRRFRELFELGVLGQEDEVLLEAQPVSDRGIGEPSLSRDDEVLDLLARLPQPVVELDREVLVEQKFQDTSLTAGGRRAATKVAYRRAVRTYSRVSTYASPTPLIESQLPAPQPPWRHRRGCLRCMVCRTARQDPWSPLGRPPSLPLERMWCSERAAGPLEDAGDVEDESPVGVDRLQVGEAHVGFRLVADRAAVGFLGVDSILQISGGREHAGVDDEGVAMRLGGLVVMVGVADGAAVGEEDEPGGGRWWTRRG